MESPRQDEIPRNSVDRERKRERMSLKKRELHELPNTEMVKFWTISVGTRITEFPTTLLPHLPGKS